MICIIRRSAATLVTFGMLLIGSVVHAQERTATKPAPLIVVDGVVLGSLAPEIVQEFVGTFEIATIEVVKGAAAEKLYGPRGRHGVISITLKGTDAERTARREEAVAAARAAAGAPLPAEVAKTHATVREAVEAAIAGAEVARSPLYIVDGVVISGRAKPDLEALDIESIEVIKGRAAQVRYGSRAAGGVIVITTKK